MTNERDNIIQFPGHRERTPRARRRVTGTAQHAERQNVPDVNEPYNVGSDEAQSRTWGRRLRFWRKDLPLPVHRLPDEMRVHFVDEHGNVIDEYITPFGPENLPPRDNPQQSYVFWTSVMFAPRVIEYAVQVSETLWRADQVRRFNMSKAGKSEDEINEALGEPWIPIPRESAPGVVALIGMMRDAMIAKDPDIARTLMAMPIAHDTSGVAISAEAADQLYRISKVLPYMFDDLGRLQSYLF